MPNVIYKDDKEYPKLLKRIGKQTPKCLYFKGNWDKEIFNNCLAVVGTRKLTSYGRQTIEQLVGKITLAGITIVSGFMYGGDAAAHQATLKAGGRTIAVMPCGIDRVHPEDQSELYQEILDNNGLVLSEYKGNMAPVLWTYPQRNRIIAGLSKALLIIEAGDKSGCLIIANYARKFKRKIFVAPGQITSSVSKGSNVLIKQGAEMVLEADDILKHYAHVPARSAYAQRRRAGYDSKKLPFSRNTLGESPGNIEEQILDLLGRESLGADELSRQLGMPISELSVKLSAMEMRGIIKLNSGKYVAN